jgi:hypothetical protein
MPLVHPLSVLENTASSSNPWEDLAASTTRENLRRRENGIVEQG